MKLRENFPNTKEAADNFGVEIRDIKGVFKIFEPKDPTSMASIKETINEVSAFLVKNGYEPIPMNDFIENDFDYESPDEIVSLSKHGYIEAFVLFIEREFIEVVNICKEVLARLNTMDYERKGNAFSEQLIFPVKNGGDDRISEQELRQLFIDVFKETYKEDNNKLYYSIETPTKAKYKFGDNIDKIEVYKDGQSALLDMCVFKRDVASKEYNRILNIEFKHKNAAEKNIAKDVLKLMHEKQNGAFILLLKSTDSGTLSNSNTKGKGVFNKFKESFEKFKDDWSDKDEDANNKFITLVLISLEQETLIHHTIRKNSDLNAIFSFKDKFGDIKDVKHKNGWKTE